MDILTDDGMTAPTHTGLVVMLKAPANAKRRLAAQVGDLAEEAAAHLVACALEDALAWSGPTWLAPANPRDRDWLLSEVGGETKPEPTPVPQLATCGGPDDMSNDMIPAWDSVSGSTTSDDMTDVITATRTGATCGLILQQGANLGERINYIDGELRRRGRGVGRLVFVGTDCPGLDSAYLEQAALGLQRADAVLGPAGDGGVVLMGARRPWPDLSGLSWSTQDLFAELKGVCLDAGWSVATLDARKDVDTLQDLLSMGAALSGDRRQSRCNFAEWLSAHRGALLAQQPDGAAEAHRESVS